MLIWNIFFLQSNEIWRELVENAESRKVIFPAEPKSKLEALLTRNNK